MESGRGSCAECARLVRLCGGLDFFPADAEVRKLLVERLHRSARSHDHARAMIERWLETKTAAPKVADIVELAGSVRNAAEALPPGCEVCHGEPWVVVIAEQPPYVDSARRCSCPKGRALRQMDLKREEERRARAAA